MNAERQPPQRPRQPQQQPRVTQASLVAPVLKRGKKAPTPRRLAFHSASDMTPLWYALDRAAARPEAERPDILVWCGNAPGRRLVREDVDAAAAAGWGYSNYRSEMRSATFRHNGYRVDVRSSVPWFGNETNPVRIQAAWYELQHMLRLKPSDGGFGEWAYLWPTPTLTGQDLLRGTLPFGAEYPMQPPQLLELLFNGPAQGGRSELLTAPGERNGWAGMLPELYNLDMRWAYASCLHGLPYGQATHDTRRTELPLSLATVGYEPSFYKFHATIPDGWGHIGILPHREPGGSISYPWQPGRDFYGWATGAEVQVALVHGWHVTASQRIYWPHLGRHDLAREWITTLRVMRERCQRRAARGDDLAPLLANALRALVVHTVGGFNRTRRLDEGFSAYGTEAATLPAGALPVPMAHGWQWIREREQVDEWVHPEIYGTVVGRVRAKVTKKALGLPVESLVAIRTDGILTTAAPDTIGDTGTPGSWRVKWHLPYGMPAPRRTSDVLRILDEATNGRDGTSRDEGSDHDAEQYADDGGE